MNEATKIELISRAKELARDRFVNQKFNCAESTLWGICQALGLSIDEALQRAVTPFGGGFGDSRATCGALIAGAVAIGIMYGRTGLDNEQKSIAYAHTQDHYQNFVDLAGGEMCDEINELSFSDPNLRQHCAKFVTLAAELATAKLLLSPTFQSAMGAEKETCHPTGDL